MSKLRSSTFAPLAFAALALVSLPVMAVACSSTPPKGGFGTSGSSGSSGVLDPDGGILTGQDAGDAAPPPPLGYVTGRVLAPEGTIPIPDALVYLSDSAPPSIPSGTYCDKCVQLENYAFAFSAADGTFKLPVYKTGPQYIVTQKGQFRRVRNNDVQVGTTWPKGLTQLPSKTDAALGDTIPTMLLMPHAFDKVENSLKALGITEFTDLNNSGVSPFDIPGQLAWSKKVEAIFKDPAELGKYQYVFLPCTGGTNFGGSGAQCTVQETADKGRGAALVQYVKGGGKVYVTDWSYEYVRQNWKGAVTWHNEGSMSQVGYACTSGASNAPADFKDPGLKAWMGAIGESNAQLTEMWSAIKSVNQFTSENEAGQQVQQTPKVWVAEGNGSGNPTTISFQDKCGRVLYSSYHTEGDGNGGLLAQEKALLHVLLEVGVCVGKRPNGPVN
jgi:hypothetical protein